jgi:hypothetical protein
MSSNNLAKSTSILVAAVMVVVIYFVITSDVSHSDGSGILSSNTDSDLNKKLPLTDLSALPQPELQGQKTQAENGNGVADSSSSNTNKNKHVVNKPQGISLIDPTITDNIKLKLKTMSEDQNSFLHHDVAIRQRFVELKQAFAELEKDKVYTLELFDDVSFDFKVKKKDITGVGNKFNVVGSIDKYHQVLVVHHPNNLVMARIKGTDRKTYTIMSVGDGVHRISEIDPRQTLRNIPRFLVPNTKK